MGGQVNAPLEARGGVLYVLSPADKTVRVTHVAEKHRWCGVRKHGTLSEFIEPDSAAVIWDDDPGRSSAHNLSNLEVCTCQ
jgi:hypothetical protein